ncbi:hypothetical protein D1818_01320 [Aquimarina sp. BL5]|uniref:hypothetical protein n=1 Tax=Aquimarina sp. BL5 TaxID=1714860 RepID=UPI000E4C8FA4|nr:hypothetical protein [Aquimarina sp. BL5]AXT49524.1 hypothetical protein D1818_01320 [Aquimarina sp. BL5]RKM96244.1 hypothetical protein D7036_21045 [Aquimarina sp. BL5]
MKYIYILLLILVISCDDTTDVLEDNFIRGGLVVWEEIPESFRLNLLEFETIEFTEGVEDPNANIISYDLSMSYGDITVDKFITITSFPNTLSFSGIDILNALNLTREELDIAIPLRFVATITTTNGVFNGAPTVFNSDDNTNEGGDSGPELFDNSAFNQAIFFNLSLFIPPPQKLRGTSFEEPFGTDDRYTRDDAVAVGELINNPGERHVMHTATGAGVDDEIGFRSFFSNPNTTVSSPGFTSEQIGVSNDGGPTGGSFLDGNQAYQIEDTDGTVRIEFDRVPIDVTQNLTTGIQIQYFPIGGNNREDDDFLRITALIERPDGSSETLVLLDVDGLFINNGLDRWNLIDSGFLTNISAYTLTIEVAVDGGSEDIYFDQMLVYIPG